MDTVAELPQLEGMHLVRGAVTAADCQILDEAGGTAALCDAVASLSVC